MSKLGLTRETGACRNTTAYSLLRVEQELAARAGVFQMRARLVFALSR
jgi:hypothetical protein